MKKIFLAFLLMASVLSLVFAGQLCAAERASLGIMVKPVTVEYAKFAGLATTEGAYVAAVQTAGTLRPGDVILAVDGKPVRKPADLAVLMRDYLPGSVVQLDLARGSERLQVSYQLKAVLASNASLTSGHASQAVVGVPFPAIAADRFEQEVLKSERPVLAYFYANWCAPCKLYLPIVKEVQEEHPDIKVVGIDIDKHREVVARYGISGILPAAILFNSGMEIDKVMRPSRKELLDSMLEKVSVDSQDVEVFASIGQGSWVKEVFFVAGTPLLVSRTAGQAIQVWNHRIGTLQQVYRAAVSGLAPGGGFAVLSDEKRTGIRLIDLVTGKERLLPVQQFIEQLAVSPSGKTVASFGVGQNGEFEVELWSNDGRLLKSIPVARGIAPQSVLFAFAPDGNSLALSSPNKLEFFTSPGWGRDLMVQQSGIARVLQFTSDSRAVHLMGNRDELIDLQGKRHYSSGGRSVFGKPDQRLLVKDNGDNSFNLVGGRAGEEEVRFVGHRAPVNSGAVSAESAWLASASSDGTVRLWNQATGKEVTRFAAFPDGEWIVMTPEGYYAASPHGHEQMHIRRGRSVYGIDQFYDVFYRPDIVATKLQGGDISGLATLTVEEAVKSPPPVVQFKPLETAGSASLVKVCYQVRTGGGGIGEVRLFQNGKLIKSDGFYRELPVLKEDRALQLAALNSSAIQHEQRALVAKGKLLPGAVVQHAKGELVDECFDLEPVPGENEVSLAAFNAANTVQSRMASIRFNSTRPATEPQLYILAVGIDRYADPSINLRYAAKDARDFGALLAAKSATLFKPSTIHMITLQNEQATKQQIMAAITRLAGTIQHNDSFVFFDASHGLLLQNQYYLVAGNFDGRLEDRNSLISSNEIVEMSKRIKSLSQLFVFDTCHAGGVDSIVSGLYDARMAVLARKMGLHIFASAGGLQTALDGYQGNGLYTHTLLEGLQNGGDNNNPKGGKVTITTLGAYSQKRTTQISATLGHPQTPLIISYGKDSALFIAQ